MTHTSLLCAAPFIALLSACSAQVEPGYVGEPMAILHGSVTGATANTNVSAGLIWTGVSKVAFSGFVGGATTPAETTGAFPSTFELRVFDPPPPSALGLFPPPDGSFPVSGHVAIAQIVALAEGTSKDFDPANVVGTDLQHGIFYLDEDAAPGSPEEYWADHFGVRGTRGYHVFTTSWSSDERLAYDVCRYADVCEKIDGIVDRWRADAASWDLARCLAVSPNAVSCEHADGASSDDAPCLAELRRRRGAAKCDDPRRCVEGDSSDLTVTLGASIWEVRIP